MKSRPVVLLADGRLQHEQMRKERVTESEIHAALRRQGLGALDGATVVLETDGSFSVIRVENRGDGSALIGLK